MKKLGTASIAVRHRSHFQESLVNIDHPFTVKRNLFYDSSVVNFIDDSLYLLLLYIFFKITILLNLIVAEQNTSIFIILL